MYYIPMTIVIMVSTFIVEFIEDKKTYKTSIITFFVSCICSLLIIYILGGGAAKSFSDGGLSFFNINLNTFINPQGYSYFLKDLSIATPGENEAFGYLGMGMLLMCFLSIIIIIKNYTLREIIDIIKKPNAMFITLCIFFSVILAIRNFS